MRRKEFSMEEEQEIRLFLERQSFGYLGTIGPDGWPSITPLNFVFYQGNLYFHGSKIGQKMANLQADPRVTFAVAEEYALIPSYFSDPQYACPATAFYKSVLLKGTARSIDDLSRKAEVLGAFMKKLQPEGGYVELNAEDPGYAAPVKGVAVVEIAVSEITAKFKFGQNLKEKKRENIQTRLQERGLSKDAETAELMSRYCPYHQAGEK
ncbi:pyridoxamine 5'-phosphate oxidase family protein [Gorillibacterium timonense]|uniref:pyridoxamine 5'-phosphate oxidase family protein n=1 Tax=Gorillibacterium timonense TaxID=1689269 RepID=UPI00071E55CF|nr:pyridoxamine 5'-phosphate oxidase family protein [Gorillibacterium timonense]